MKKKSQGVSSQWASQAFFNPRAILCIFVLMPQIFSVVQPASLMHVCLIRLQGFESATQNAFTRLCRSKGGQTRISSVQRLSKKNQYFLWLCWNLSGTIRNIRNIMKRFELSCRTQKVLLKMCLLDSVGQKGARLGFFHQQSFPQNINNFDV